MKVLSYNIFFKAMQRKPLYKSCTLIDGQYTSCLESVSKFIENNAPYDFVGLQEATNWQTVQKITPVLRKMIAVSYRAAKEQIVTFYDKRYELDADTHQLTGYMVDENRPFIILFFRNNLCVVNLHAGHHRDIYQFDRYLKDVLAKSNVNYLKKLMTYDIIVMGDFNDKLDAAPFTILDRKLFGVNTTPTCCNDNLQLVNLRSAFDHILTTFPGNKSNAIPVYGASDHMPIIATLTKNIGYDSDGMSHLDVERHHQVAEFKTDIVTQLINFIATTHDPASRIY